MKKTIAKTLRITTTAMLWLLTMSPSDAYLLWKGELEGKTVHVLAVTPAMTEGLSASLPAEVTGAYEAAALIAFETQADPERRKQERRKIIDQALYPEGESVTQHLPAETTRRLETVLRDLNVQNRGMLRVQPWATAHNLMNIASTRAGVKLAENLETYFQQKALNDGKSTDTLNKPDEVVALYNALTKAEQVKILEMALRDAAALNTIYQQRETAWVNGDADAAAALINGSFAEYQDIQRALFDETNRRWAKKIAGMTRFDDVIMVVVPLPHAVGQFNLLDHLREQGFSVAQVVPVAP